jgi:GT2 family glycosyltransferase
MVNNVELSIIIINYNTYALTLQCIKSIVKETTAISYEIIIVDNASTEIPKHEFSTIHSSIKVIKNKNNVGFGIANNVGMEAAKGNYILLLNSDTIIIQNGIAKSLKYIKENSEIGVLTCQQLNEKRKPFIPASFYFKDNSIVKFLIQNPLFEIIKSKITPSTQSPLTKNCSVNSLSGAFMLFNKEVFEKTKGFDPDFFMYYEETEWCMRLKKQYQLFYLHDVSFIHLHGKSSPRLIMQQQMLLSQGLFWYKSGYLSYFFFLLITYLINIPSWFVLSVFSIKKTSRKHFLKYLNIYIELFPYYISEIFSSKNNYGSRTQNLKLKDL